MIRLILITVLLVFRPLATAQEIRRALPVDATLPSAPISTTAPADNDLARFLAGQPASAYAAWQSDAFYRDYAKKMSQLWDRYETYYYLPFQAWSREELAPRLAVDRPVFYFFGGPDILAPLAFFPSAPVYILGGLEPVGSIAPPASLAPLALNEALDNLRQSTEVILSYGHFITKDMKAEFERSAFRGVLPVMSAFLALSGCDIVSIDYIGITGDGTLKDFGHSLTGAKGVLPGLRIQFRRHAGAPVQTLYYIQANVADDALKGSLLRWASSFGSGTVYLKAASYLMHETYFSKIRSFLLDHADAVLQDDSGIPFRFFQQGGWQLTLYGGYNGTLDIFKKYYQPDLAAAYQSGANPLEFGTGYKWRKGESNLLLAIRAQTPPQP